MHVILWIVLILVAILGVVGLAFSISSLLYLRKYVRDSHVTIGTVVSQTQDKRTKKMLPVVQFRTSQKKVTVKAMLFESATIAMGQKVNIRYLASDKLSPEKWDVRIIGKSGYGKERTTRLSAIVLAVAAVLFVGAIVVMIVCG